MFLTKLIFVLTCIVAILGQQYSSLDPYSPDGPPVSSNAIPQLRTSDFTFIATIQPEIIPKDNATYGAIINKGVKDDEDSFHLELHFDGRLVAYGLNISYWVNFDGISPSPDGRCSALTSNTILQPNEIYEITIIRNHEAFLLYVNGKLDISVIATVYDSLNKDPITVGMHNKIDDSVFQGNIWGIKIFQQALSPDQMRQQAQGAEDDDSEVENMSDDESPPPSYKSQNGEKKKFKIDEYESDDSAEELQSSASEEIQSSDSEPEPKKGGCKKCHANAKCVLSQKGKKVCVCNKGYRMERDGKTCVKHFEERNDSYPTLNNRALDILPIVLLVIIMGAMALVARPVIAVLYCSK